jgi:NADH-ubiquinone oxidoreductase ASHI subunit (CI-ASHI or NDUFB8)
LPVFIMKLFEWLLRHFQYGLIPEDYKPFPENESYGDYPDLKPSSADSRPGNEYWDVPEFRRNFNEPLHLHFDMQQDTR